LVQSSPVPVLSLGIPRALVVPRGPVGGDDGDECAGGGDEESFHGEGEAAEGGEAEVCAVGCCSTLVSVSCCLLGNLTFASAGGKVHTKARPISPPLIPPFRVAL